MASKPIRVFYSPLSQRFFATRSYKQEAPGIVLVTGEKHDVTDDIVAIVKERGIKFDEYREKFVTA